MQIFSYSILLSTGETLEIAEIPVRAMDSWTKKALEEPIRSEIRGVLSLCTKAPHSAMEDAKIGYTKPLERLIRISPIGALTKLDRPMCAHAKDCIMVQGPACSARPAAKKFPECWDYSLLTETFEDGHSAAQELAKAIVMAWRDGKYVVISD